MNTTVTTRRILGHHHLLVLLAGAAIVLAVGAGLTWRVNGNQNQLVSRPVAGSAHFYPFEQYVTYYIVASEAQRQLAQNSELQAANARDGSNSSGAEISYAIVQLRSPPEEASFAMELEQRQTDPTFHV